MSHAEVERAQHHRPGGPQRAIGAKVLPEAERDRRQFETATPTAAIGPARVAVGCGDKDHSAQALCALSTSRIPTHSRQISVMQSQWIVSWSTCLSRK